jgi:hypothetical protein
MVFTWQVVGMSLSDATKRHVITKYVNPARSRGERSLEVKVGNVVRDLGLANRTPSVFSTLLSRTFQREAGLELLEKRGGPASGGPSTTVHFVYRILREKESSQKVNSWGEDLMSLYGIGGDVFRELGGGEEYLKRERESLQFPMEGYPRKGER